MDRTVARRDRAGAAAGAEGRLDDGQLRRQGGAQGNQPDQGDRAAHPNRDLQPGDPDLRRRRPHTRYAARLPMDLGPGAADPRRAGRGPSAHYRPARDQGSGPVSGETLALDYAADGDRAAARIAGVSPDTPLRDIGVVAVI